MRADDAYMVAREVNRESSEARVPESALLWSSLHHHMVILRAVVNKSSQSQEFGERCHAARDGPLQFICAPS